MSSTTENNVVGGGPYYGGFEPPTPNYVNPPSLAPMILATNFVALGLSLFAVSLRLWARIGILRKVSAEDYLITFSWLLSAFMTFCACYSLSRGIGRHAWDIPPEIMFGVPKFPSQYVIAILYTVASCLIKVSILLFYLRLNPNMHFRRACFVTITFVALIAVGTLPPAIFACNPIDAMWNPGKLLNGGKCIDLIPFWNAGAAINTFSDVIILILPLSMIYKSHLPFVQKVHVLILFTLGGLLLIASIVRLIITVEAGLDPYDFTWSGSRSMAWSSVEINVGIVVACLPAVRSLLARIFPRLFAVTPTPSDPGPRRHNFNPRATLHKHGKDLSVSTTTSSRSHEMTSFSTEVYDGRSVYDKYSANVVSGNTSFNDSRETLQPPLPCLGGIEKCVEVAVTIESRRTSVDSDFGYSTWSSNRKIPV